MIANSNYKQNYIDVSKYETITQEKVKNVYDGSPFSVETFRKRNHFSVDCD